MAERGHSLESIKASIEARKPDFDAYIGNLLKFHTSKFTYNQELQSSKQVGRYGLTRNSFFFSFLLESQFSTHSLFTFVSLASTHTQGYKPFGDY